MDFMLLWGEPLPLAGNKTSDSRLFNYRENASLPLDESFERNIKVKFCGEVAVVPCGLRRV